LGYDQATSKSYQASRLAGAAKAGQPAPGLDLRDGGAAGQAGLAAPAVHGQKVARLGKGLAGQAGGQHLADDFQIGSSGVAHAWAWPILRSSRSRR
jgi:hypothetical protein